MHWQASKPRTRWPQISLRGPFWIALAVGLGFGAYVSHVQLVEQQYAQQRILDERALEVEQREQSIPMLDLGYTELPRTPLEGDPPIEILGDRVEEWKPFEDDPPFEKYGDGVPDPMSVELIPLTWTRRPTGPTASPPSAP